MHEELHTLDAVEPGHKGHGQKDQQIEGEILPAMRMAAYLKRVAQPRRLSCALRLMSKQDRTIRRVIAKRAAKLRRPDLYST